MIHMHAHAIPMNTKRTRVVFLIDDDPLQQQLIADFIKGRFLIEFHVFSTGEEALKNLYMRPEVIILDYHLESNQADAANGIAILQKLNKELPMSQVIMLSGQDSLAIAADCIKHGAFDYIVKGETSFSRLEQILNNIDQMMDDIYFRKFNSDMLKLLLGLFVLGTGFVAYAINAGWMEIILHF